MPVPTESDCAARLLRLLLDDGDQASAMAGMDWDRLRAIAQRNGVLLRAAEHSTRLGLTLPHEFMASVQAERARTAAMLTLMRSVADACDANHITFIFPKALAHYPDMGSDLDLLVRSRSRTVDTVILAGLAATPVAGGFGDRVAGRTTYAVAGCPAPLDILHGRLGSIGEQTNYPVELLRHLVVRTVGDGTFEVPSAEALLVLQGMQKVLGRRGIHLSDVVATCRAVRSDSLDWALVGQQARGLGVLAGLSCYLSFVEQIHRTLLGAALLPAPVADMLVSARWGRIEFRGGKFRFPALRANALTGVAFLGARLALRDWPGAIRLCCMPLAGVLATGRRLRRRRTPAAASPAPLANTAAT